jgi:erythromycin esterase
MQTISKAIVLLFCCIASMSTAQQSIKKFIEQNLVEVNNISPYTNNYNDYEPIGQAIGDAKIVMIGEQSHGDAPVFLAKTKLVKYLHEVKGFNVLAFESDFYGLNEGWDKLTKTPTEVEAFLRGNINPIWTRCDACQQLFHVYIPGTFTTSQPLQITGFDNQLFFNYSYDLLSVTLDSVLRSYDLPITKTAEYTSNIIPYIDSLTNWYEPYKDTTQYKRSDIDLKQIKKELSARLSADNFWMMTLDNLIAANRQFWLSPTRPSSAYFEARDKQMADNISWLSRVKYPDEKIIIWAHNYHISKQNMDKEEPFYGKTSMGGFMSRDSALIAQTYVMGFTSYAGTSGIIGLRKLMVSAKKNSMESWVNKAFRYGFIDFTTYPGNHEKRFMMKGQGHYHAKEAWMKEFDGFFYIHTMYPCINILGE